MKLQRWPVLQGVKVWMKNAALHAILQTWSISLILLYFICISSRSLCTSFIVTAQANIPTKAKSGFGLNSVMASKNTTHHLTETLINQPLLNRLSWTFAWWLFRWKESSQESKKWPCSTAVFHAALQNRLNTLQPIYQPFLNGLR